MIYDFVTAKGLNATTNAYKYFFSSFTPSTLVENSKYIKDNNNSIMTPMEMWDCALGYFNTNNCGRTALLNNYTNLNKLATTCVDLIPQQVGEMGILMMVNGFSECMKVYLKPAIKFIPLEDVITADSDITQSLNNLISQTEPNEYVIDSTNVTEMTYYTGRKSYSFTVEPKSEDIFFQNIVIEKGSDNIVYNNLVEYSLNTNLEQIPNINIEDFIIDRKTYPISQLPTNYSTMRQRGVMFYECEEQGVFISVLKSEGNLVGYGNPKYYNSDNSPKTKLVFVITDRTCGIVYRDYGPNPIPGGGGGTPPGYTPPEPPTYEPPKPPVVSVPTTTTNLLKFLKIIKSDEENDEIVAYLYDPNNILIRTELFDYLRKPDSDLGFAFGMITQCMNNLGVFTSIKPFLIEKQIDDSGLDPCPKGVLQQVKNTTNSDIAKVLAKLNANSSVYNLTMISDVPPTGGTPAQTMRVSPFNYKTYISTDYSDKTKLFMAASMFHELIHAYFLSIVDDYNSNPTNNQNLYNLNSFPSLFQAYCDKKYPPAQGQSQNIHHVEMANYYVDAIARALQEYQTGIPEKIKDLQFILLNFLNIKGEHQQLPFLKTNKKPVHIEYVIGEPKGSDQFIVIAGIELGINVKIEPIGSIHSYTDENGVVQLKPYPALDRFELENKIANKYYIEEIGIDWKLKLHNKITALFNDNQVD